VWRVEGYQSGTVVATTGLDRPWFDVHGPIGLHDAMKWGIAEDICSYMNGGKRANWFDELRIVGKDKAETVDRVMIYVCGPMIDRNPPGLDWVTDMSEQAIDERERLMLRLLSAT
jgi:hypothetical protein